MNEKPYTIEQRPHGVAIFGSVPATEMADLLREYDEVGLTLLDQKIARALDAVIVVTDEEGSREWRESLDLEVK